MKKQTKKRLLKIFVAVGIGLAMIAIFIAASYGRAMPVLDTHGTIANQERDLIYLTMALGAVVVIPVFVMLFVIAWRYRETNTKAVYEPDYDHNKKIEALWWGIPCVIIIALAIITGYATHALDPSKPLQSDAKPLTIQVVALQWRWLFIYPNQNIATLNYVNIPEKTPITFTITADAPVNSFWIPALAGQIYAMSGMSTQLNVIADDVGIYNGKSANISGTGFADMTFNVYSMKQTDFADWKNQAVLSSNILSRDRYKELAKPSTDKAAMTFTLMEPTLYNDIMVKARGGSLNNITPGMAGMSM